MYKELDTLLLEQSSEDAWYDYYCEIACQMLTEFSVMDWEELSNQALGKPIEWQRKLAYILDNEMSMHELNILISLLDVKDEELFEICVDTLRSYSSPESKERILAVPQILQRIDSLLPTASLPVKKILQDFLAKMHA